MKKVAATASMLAFSLAAGKVRKLERLIDRGCIYESGDHYYSTTGGWGEHASLCPEDETDYSGTYRCAKNYNCGDCYNCDK